MNKDRLIQLIHIAKNHTRQCVSCGTLFIDTDERCMCGSKESTPLSDGRYRSSLEMVTGKRSCKDMDLQDLERVYRLFSSIGFRPTRTKVDPKRELAESLAHLRWAIEQRAPEVLGENWKRRMDGFLRNMGKDSLRFCSHTELRKIHGWLSRIKKKEEKESNSERRQEVHD